MDPFSNIVGFILGDPTSKELAALSLVLAIVVNFVLGNLIGVVRGSWSLSRWSDLIYAKLFTPETEAIGLTLVTGIAAAAGTAFAGHNGLDTTWLKAYVLPAFITAVAAEAALYSSAIWHEDYKQFRDFTAALAARISRKPVPALRNISDTYTVSVTQLEQKVAKAPARKKSTAK